jgi:hypothetical protein
MSDGTLVRGIACGKLVLFCLGGAGALTALAVLMNNGQAALPGLVAFVLLVVALVKLPELCIRKVYLAVRPAGITVRDWNGRRELTDADVTAVGWDETVELSNGVPKGMQRKATLTVAEGPPVLMDYLVRTGGPDPVAPLIRRLTERILAGARDQLARGQRFTGSGWALDREGFWTSGRDGDRLIPTAALAGAVLIDHHLAVWEQGQEQPSAKIRAGEPNVRVLAALLKDRVAGRGRPDVAEEDLGGGLGRMLFERDHSLHVVVFALLLLLALALAGVAILMVAAPQLIPTKGSGLFGFVSGGVAVIVGLPTLAYRRNRFACHQRGVCRTTFWGTRRLRYEDVGSFTYAAVRRYMNGVFTGMTVRLTFVPREGVRGGRLKFQISAHKIDQALDGLRDGVAEMVARDLLARLGAGEAVRWTAGYMLAPQGLVCPARGLFGRQRLVPYRDLQPPVMNDGFLWLYAVGDRKPFASIPCRSPNFFPGLVVLERALLSPAAVPSPGTHPRAPLSPSA